MTNYKQKQEWERWTCKCGIKRKIKGKNKPCPYCKSLPKKQETSLAKKSQISRHL